MVLNVTRLRNRGFTRRWPLPLDPLPFWDPSPVPFVVAFPIFEKHARIIAGGNPVNADCGYSPRSAASMEEGSKSLPTMWIDHSFVCPLEAAAPSAMPPFRPPFFASFPFPLLDPLPPAYG